MPSVLVHKKRRHLKKSESQRIDKKSEIDKSDSMEKNSTSTSANLTTKSSTAKSWTLPANVENLLITKKCVREHIENGYCQHDGKCWMAQTMMSDRGGGFQLGPFCQCPVGWIGQRCQYMDVGVEPHAPYISELGRDSSKMIARVVGLSFAGLVLLAALTVLGFVYYRRQKEKGIGRPRRFAKVSRAIFDMRQKYSLRRTDKDVTCNFIESDELQLNLQQQPIVENGNLCTVCQQKVQVPLWKNQSTTTTVSAAPWSQVNLGSPVPNAMLNSTADRWSPSALKSMSFSECRL